MLIRFYIKMNVCLHSFKFYLQLPYHMPLYILASYLFYLVPNLVTSHLGCSFALAHEKDLLSFTSAHLFALAQSFADFKILASFLFAIKCYMYDWFNHFDYSSLPTSYPQGICSKPPVDASELQIVANLMHTLCCFPIHTY